MPARRSRSNRSSRRSSRSPRRGNARRVIEPSYATRYNGWTNWPTWSVALWLGNDEHLDRAAERRYKNDGRFTAKSAETFVREAMPGGTPDMRSSHHRGRHGGYGVVNWQEIAS